jgi:hypothetical protein
VNRCGFRPRSFAAAEAGCPLDHAPCGVHVVDGDGHEDVCEECKTFKFEGVEEDDGLGLDPPGWREALEYDDFHGGGR